MIVWLFRYFFIRWCEKPKCMTLSPHPWTIFFCVPWSFLCLKSFLCLFLKSHFHLSLCRSLEEAVRVVRTVHQLGEAVGGARQAGSKIGRTYQFHLESLSNQGPKGKSQARQVGLLGGLLWRKVKSGLASSATRSGRTWLMLWVWNMSVLAGQRGSGFACAHSPSKGMNTGGNCTSRNSSRSMPMKLFLRVSTWRQAIDEFICIFLILHMYSYVFHFSMIHGCINVLMYYVFMYVLFIYLMYFVLSKINYSCLIIFILVHHPVMVYLIVDFIIYNQIWIYRYTYNHIIIYHYNLKYIIYNDIMIFTYLLSIYLTLFFVDI